MGTSVELGTRVELDTSVEPTTRAAKWLSLTGAAAALLVVPRIRRSGREHARRR